MTRDSALRRQAHDWALKLRTGRPTTEDVAAFKRWRDGSPAHAQAWSQAVKDWKTVGETAQVFRAAHPASASTPVRRGRRMFLGAGLSAAGALAVVGAIHPPLGLWPSLREWGADYRTRTGEQRTVRLGRQLDLALNTQTSVDVSEAGGVARIALISGEAAILANDARCEVVAGAGRVTLSDADIEIRRLSHARVRVVCLRGHAELHHGEHSVPLRAGEQTVFNRERASAPGAAAEGQSAWRQGRVVFDGMPLSEAVDEINRYRPGRVVLADSSLAARRFTASFNINALDEAIDVLHEVYGVPVRRMGELVLLG
ncbi:transmembrane sensor [Bordetella ansorpii]|uniref:Transmembrane sensor n=1 Tax=Bordetella ansorpii TaxID=288768 RepID=A0A157SDY1_9BORD|nr:DUF4880 domain-containing protein [Bordetella ansorpii]SAI68433.1 transmembrane sensor [Bordetella ansorpii]